MMNRSRDEREGTIVYVGGLLSEITKEDIEREFKTFGELVRVWVAFNPPGFAFVEFSNKEDAEAAVKRLHGASVLGPKLRVEISRGRGKGGRGGMPGRGGSRGGRGGFSGGRGDSDFSRGRGSSRGGFGMRRPTPYDRNGDIKPFGDRGRFDDFDDRRLSGFDDRDLAFGERRSLGGARDFGGIDSPRFGGGRDFRDLDSQGGYGARGFAPRDIGGRDFPSRDLGGRDFPTRDILGGRNFEDRGGVPPRADERDFLPRGYARDDRDFGAARDMNGLRGYGEPRDAPFGGERDVGAPVPSRDFIPPARDIGRGRDFGAANIDSMRDYGGDRDIGYRREDVRDFNPPRDIADPRDFRGRGMDTGRFGAGRGRGGYDEVGGMRPGGFNGGRFPVDDVGGSGNYGDYGARDRFRTRSPIGRGRPY